MELIPNQLCPTNHHKLVWILQRKTFCSRNLNSRNI
jgi:hypothetical protein